MGVLKESNKESKWLWGFPIFYLVFIVGFFATIGYFLDKMIEDGKESRKNVRIGKEIKILHEKESIRIWGEGRKEEIFYFKDGTKDIVEHGYYILFEPGDTVVFTVKSNGTRQIYISPEKSGTKFIKD